MIENHTASYHDAVHAGTVFTEYQLRDDVVGRHVMQRCEIDEGEVGQTAFLYAPDLVEPEGARTAFGGRVKRLACRDPALDRVVLHARQVRCQAHRFEDI